jgi:hypothetical protein
MASRYVRALGLLELQVPFGTVRYRESSTNTSADVSGFGDASLHLHRFGRRGGWSGDYFVGVEVPTGTTEAAPVVGQMLPAVVQMGSGTFNPDIGACVNLRLSGTTSLSMCDHVRPVLYSNSHGYRDPAVFDARLFVSTVQFGRYVSAQAGFFYEGRSASRWTGYAAPVDGHHELFVEASVWALLYRGLSLRSTIEVPLYEYVVGTQLADTLRVMAALSYDFDRL